MSSLSNMRTPTTCLHHMNNRWLLTANKWIPLSIWTEIPKHWLAPLLRANDVRVCKRDVSDPPMRIVRLRLLNNLQIFYLHYHHIHLLELRQNLLLNRHNAQVEGSPSMTTQLFSHPQHDHKARHNQEQFPTVSLLTAIDLHTHYKHCEADLFRSGITPEASKHCTWELWMSCWWAQLPSWY